MRHFKKRALALVLASTITVVGAFGAENYKNSLMAIRFEGSQDGAVKLLMLTKRQFKTGITTTREDANTYVVKLPETNCEITEGYEFGDNVQSVDIRTMPYTKSGNGYTQITIKTEGYRPFFAKTSLFLTADGTPLEPEQPSEEEERKVEVKKVPVQSYEKQQNTIHSRSGVEQINPVDIKESVKQFQHSEQVSQTKGAANPNLKTLDDMDKERALTPKQEKWYTFLGALFAMLVMAYFWVKAKGQMENLVGEDKYDLSEEPKKTKKKEEKKKRVIKNTIKSLDKKYPKPVSMPTATLQSDEEVLQEVPEIENVVDLDELLQQQSQTEKDDRDEEENSALEDFLSSFSFEEEKEENKEKIYDECINNDSIQFSEDDVKNISGLADSEISDDIKNNVSETSYSSKKDREPSSLELFAELVTDYITQNNVTFTQTDVDAIYKLINFEINDEFVTELRTNPEFAREMQEEIEKQKSKTHKTSELLTLNVKDMLPDLSEALKKQGGRKIESEVKPQVVYFSEGYDVSTLKLNSALPDLESELNNKDAYKVRPSDEIELVDNSYEVEKMAISGLPDLKDVMANPDKYETPETKREEVSEEALLNNIMNVSFKPFDDGSREFEVLNNFEEDTPTRSDMQEEFNQLDSGFEIIEEEEIPEIEESDKDSDDFASLYDNNYVDLDKNINKDTVLEESSNVEPLDESIPNESDKLLTMIKDIEKKRKSKKSLVSKNPDEIIKEKTEEKPVPKSCVVEGEEFSVINVSYFTDSMGCYLAKSEHGYAIIGFVGDKTFKIKHYDKLNVKTLRMRKSEMLDDGTERYIVRIGIHKFILNVKADEYMEFVMDLC